MSETRIFFVVRQDPDDSDLDPHVVAEIYRDSGGIGTLLASHVMTVEGATIRMHDLQAAIATAKQERRRVGMPAVKRLRKVRP